MSSSVVALLSFLTQEEMKQVQYPLDTNVLHRTLRNRKDEICDFFFGKEYARMVDKDWKLRELISDSTAITALDQKLVGNQEEKIIAFINKAKNLEPAAYYTYCKEKRASFFPH